ncbi:hypothetical protein C8R47DRAFT_1192172 [Mycena vitilis]|nr:hypothetical protein C8R47DRAFT_1203488 [Mycena vitilis]KAJ6506203.1 hypothetical protein C8R47DRAFT_1192172 [Mycena vitilis]
MYSDGSLLRRADAQLYLNRYNEIRYKEERDEPGLEMRLRNGARKAAGARGRKRGVESRSDIGYCWMLWRERRVHEATGEARRRLCGQHSRNGGREAAGAVSGRGAGSALKGPESNGAEAAGGQGEPRARGAGTAALWAPMTASMTLKVAGRLSATPGKRYGKERGVLREPKGSGSKERAGAAAPCAARSAWGKRKRGGRAAKNIPQEVWRDARGAKEAGRRREQRREVLRELVGGGNGGRNGREWGRRVQLGGRHGSVQGWRFAGCHIKEPQALVTRRRWSESGNGGKRSKPGHAAFWLRRSAWKRGVKDSKRRLEVQSSTKISSNGGIGQQPRGRAKPGRMEVVEEEGQRMHY